MLQEEVKPEQTESKSRQMNMSDRCDRCGAEAFVYAEGLDGELLFCGHHFTKHEESIRSFAIKIIDERDWINRKPSSGE